MPYGITQSYLTPTGRISRPFPVHCCGWYSIYPPVEDERLSRPEPTQVNDLPRVAMAVPAMPGVSWLSRPDAPLGTVGVNNLPTVVTQRDPNPCLSNTSRTRYPLDRGTTPPRACFVRVTAGANTNDALLRSVDFLVTQEELDPLATRVSMLLLIADSTPTIGITNSARILSNVHRASGGRIALNVFVGTAPVGRPFFERLASQNRGALRRCCDAERGGMAADLTAFYLDTSRPLLDNVRFRYEGTSVELDGRFWTISISGTPTLVT